MASEKGVYKYFFVHSSSGVSPESQPETAVLHQTQYPFQTRFN